MDRVAQPVVPAAVLDCVPLRQVFYGNYSIRHFEPDFVTLICVESDCGVEGAQDARRGYRLTTRFQADTVVSAAEIQTPDRLLYQRR